MNADSFPVLAGDDDVREGARLPVLLQRRLYVCRVGVAGAQGHQARSCRHFKANTDYSVKHPLVLIAR